MESEEALRNSEIVTLQQYTYGYESHCSYLYVTSLLTGKSRIRGIRSFRFKMYSSWCALPYSYICFTGGHDEHLKLQNELMMLDTQREFDVQIKCPMITARESHNSLWHEGFLYVISGFDHSRVSGFLSECERYSLVENRWESIPPIPIPSIRFGIIQLNHNHVYVFGGVISERPIIGSLIQELSLERLEWRIHELKFPLRTDCPPVFKVRESECYFLDKNTLYCFIPSTSQIHQVKPLQSKIGSFFGPSYYSQGILYCSNFKGEVKKLAVGSLI